MWRGTYVVEAPDHGLGADVLGALVAAGAESPAAAALSGPVGVKPDAFGLKLLFIFKDKTVVKTRAFKLGVSNQGFGHSRILIRCAGPDI